MHDFFENSLFAGVTLSLISYLIGSILKKKFKLGIFNPLLISIVVTILVLVVSKVDYDTYNEGAQYLSWLLTPATVCLAIPSCQIRLTLEKNDSLIGGFIIKVGNKLRQEIAKEYKISEDRIKVFINGYQTK